MNNEKSIFGCYEELKRREVRELENAVRAAGGEVEFGEDSYPMVMCNLDGHFSHPADVRITRVELVDEEDEDVLHIYGNEKGYSGCSEWFEDEREINFCEIAYGHISFITDALIGERPKINVDKSTGRLCETVAELSQMLYSSLYLKLGGSREVCEEILHLAVKFEESYNLEDDNFLEKIDEFARDYFKTINN